MWYWFDVRHKKSQWIGISVENVVSLKTTDFIPLFYNQNILVYALLQKHTEKFFDTLFNFDEYVEIIEKIKNYKTSQ